METVEKVKEMTVDNHYQLLQVETISGLKYVAQLSPVE